MSFNQNTTGAKAFIFGEEKSVVFLKLYLISKEQLADILRNNYGIVKESQMILNDLKGLNKIGKST
jgi:hypothetical protein